MRLGITLEDENGIYSNVPQHFGQCKYFFLADIENDKIKGTRMISNAARRIGGRRLVVDEILRHKITHLIAGGIGTGAQQKFARAGVQIFGYSGRVKEAIEAYKSGKLKKTKSPNAGSRFGVDKGR